MKIIKNKSNKTYNKAESPLIPMPGFEPGSSRLKAGYADLYTTTEFNLKSQ